MDTKITPLPWFAKRSGFSTVYIESRLRDGWLQEVAALRKLRHECDEAGFSEKSGYGWPVALREADAAIAAAEGK